MFPLLFLACGRNRRCHHHNGHTCHRCRCCGRCCCRKSERQGLSSFGGMWTGAETVAISEPDTFGDLPMYNAYPTQNIDISGNGLEITQDGVYEVSYSMYGASNAVTSATLAVLVNGSPAPGASLTKSILGAAGRTYNGSAMVTLFAGDRVTLGVSAAGPVQIGLGYDVGASLTLKKLDGEMKAKPIH
ncbi:MAG: hypothetical protein FWD16_01755 [Clostridia bacterium]|nr:hypothetical protein [Clostridia bacterium]